MDFILALGYFTALAGIFLAKLIPVWNHAIPGGLEDTRLFLWNAWWFHYAIRVLHTNPFHTMMLFHPFGASLISHDFPLWMNLVTFIGQREGLSMIAASNLWFALSWILAGFCAYGLAREVTGQPAAGIVAGTFVMTHSYLLARAMQNWGQFNLYGIPLFLWSLIRARRRNNTASFVLAGAALAWTAACHYYFLIYSVLIWLAVAALDLSPYSLQVTRRQTIRGRARKVLLSIAAGFGLIGISIWAHPRIVHLVHLGHLAIGMQTPQNVLFVMWILLMIWGATHLRISFELSEGLLLPSREKVGMRDGPRTSTTTPSLTSVLSLEGRGRATQFRNHMLLIATAALLLTPLFWETFKLISAGGYPRQSILWKTHNSGANLFALFMPNPLQAIWGPAVSAWFTVRGMQPQDQAASLGWVCLAVVILARFGKASPLTPLPRADRAHLNSFSAPSPGSLREGDRRSGEAWLWLALSATILSMGTHLHIAEHNLWCPLPFFFLRLLPILGNVRIPERWMAVGAVAWSVVLAQSVVKLAAQRGWSLRKLSALATALILLENWPGIPYAAVPPVSPVYERLRQLPAGAVLTVPLYIGDSSIGTGDAMNGQFIFPWDHLWAQIAHQKPILGGYIGRISHRMIDDYKADPFIHRLLDLEEGKIQVQEPEPAYGRNAVQNLNFSYVLVYPSSTNPDALSYALESLPLEIVDQDSSIQLYRIK